MNRELDLNPLVRLKEALEGAQKNTTRMLAKLEKFDSRLTDLDSKIRPLQNATAKYTRARENISMTLIEVGKTYEYFRIANEVRDIINDGLNENNKKDFFDALGNLCSAKQFFESHDEIKSSNSVLGNIRDLLEVLL